MQATVNVATNIWTMFSELGFILPDIEILGRLIQEKGSISPINTVDTLRFSIGCNRLQPIEKYSVTPTVWPKRFHHFHPYDLLGSRSGIVYRL